MEFIFFNEYSENRDSVAPLIIPDTIKKEFQFIHSDPNGVPNEEWGHWKKKLNEGLRTPVFYLTNKDGSVHSIGLAFMYRLPYAYSVRQAIEHTSPDHFHRDPDLAETIFGFVDGSEDALKGRVAFSPAIATKAEPTTLVTTVLGAPKPSFYPNYIEQPVHGGQYKTFMDWDGRIRGWKRYPARLIMDVKVPPGVADPVDTWLIPLRENAKFTFRVKLHNLKPVELGAVVWALTWGNNSNLRHSLGMGKAMGYGQAKITITNKDVDWESAMNSFVELMDREAGGSWGKTAQMEQLLAMANPDVSPQCGSLRHLSLKPRNEFVQAKRETLALLPHKLPTAKKDEDRFKDVLPRATGSGSSAPSDKKSNAVQPAPSASLAASTPAIIWPNASLSFNPGSGGILTASFEGKKATVKLTSETRPLIAPDILERLMKKREARGTVTVELIGGNSYGVIKVESH
jgi:hypothetical protein